MSKFNDFDAQIDLSFGGRMYFTVAKSMRQAKVLIQAKNF